jgi:hypothetical protein
MHPLTDFRFITMGVVLALNSPGLFADQPGQNQPGIVPGSASVAPATRILAAGGASPIQNSGQVSASADPRIGQVLGVPTSFCGHVINMLMINQMRQQNGTTGADFPPGLQFFPGTTVTPGDIELLGVHLVADGNPQQGPVFQLTIRTRLTESEYRLLAYLVRSSSTARQPQPRPLEWRPVRSRSFRFSCR